MIETVLKAVAVDGLSMDRTPADDVDFPDLKDIVFYEGLIERGFISDNW